MAGWIGRQTIVAEFLLVLSDTQGYSSVCIGSVKTLIRQAEFNIPP